MRTLKLAQIAKFNPQLGFNLFWVWGTSHMTDNHAVKSDNSDNNSNLSASQVADIVKQEFSIRLSDLIAEKKLTQVELSQKSRIATSKISDYVRGKFMPSAESIIELADALEVRPQWLVLGRGERTENSPSSSHRVPILDVRLAAGAGQWQTSEHTIGSMALDDEFMRQIGRTSTQGLVMMRVEGDSNAPEIKDGAPILIDENEKRIREGFIYAFRYGDDLRIKRLRPVGLGDIEAISSNPLYPPELITSANRDHFAIIGRAIWTGTRL